jgi:hypothetical protein
MKGNESRVKGMRQKIQMAVIHRRSDLGGCSQVSPILQVTCFFTNETEMVRRWRAASEAKWVRCEA